MAQTYNDGMSDNMIQIITDADNYVWIIDYKVDAANVKLFAALLNNTMICYLEKNFTKLRQWVRCDDWDNFLNQVEGWNIIYDDLEANVKLIECEIGQATRIIMESFL